jgi:hypothetical protein
MSEGTVSPQDRTQYQEKAVDRWLLDAKSGEDGESQKNQKEAHRGYNKILKKSLQHSTNGATWGNVSAGLRGPF